MKVPRIGGIRSVAERFCFQQHGPHIIESRDLWLVCNHKAIQWYESQRRKAQ